MSLLASSNFGEAAVFALAMFSAALVAIAQQTLP
jgi:hypothetical protein